MNYTGRQTLLCQLKFKLRIDRGVRLRATVVGSLITILIYSITIFSNTAPAFADQNLAKQIKIFDDYCRAYYTSQECEGALRHILADRGANYLAIIGYVEDPKPFFENLKEVIEFGRIYQPQNRDKILVR